MIKKLEKKNFIKKSKIYIYNKEIIYKKKEI